MKRFCHVLKNCFVTYSNKAKRKLVGVKKETLEKHGAVSKQVAKEMANLKNMTYEKLCETTYNNALKVFDL